MKKVIQVKKGSRVLDAVITCLSKGAPFQTDGAWWNVVDARKRDDGFVDIVLEQVNI